MNTGIAAPGTHRENANPEDDMGYVFPTAKLRERSHVWTLLALIDDITPKHLE